MEKIKKFEELNYDTSYHVVFQWGTEDEGVLDFGIVDARNRKDAIKKAVDNYTENIDDREFYYKYAITK
jgi:hypothetical protein